MLQHFDRNMNRKSTNRVMTQPDYLGFFVYKEIPKIDKDKYRAVKKGEYSLEKEEMDLNDIIKDIQRQDVKHIGRKIRKVGLLNFKVNPNSTLSK